MIPLLVEASPGFDPMWREFQSEWTSDQERPYYLALGNFARHMSSLMCAAEDATLHRIFDTVECLLVEGDDYVKQAAAIGLLEDLQNTNLHKGSTPEQFVSYLRPQSLRWWKKIDEFWTRGVPIVDD